MFFKDKKKKTLEAGKASAQTGAAQNLYKNRLYRPQVEQCLFFHFILCPCLAILSGGKT
jgi:hypothetical protein